jgi:DNA-binding LytR/AlgR family response regulator
MRPISGSEIRDTPLKDLQEDLGSASMHFDGPQMVAARNVNIAAFPRPSEPLSAKPIKIAIKTKGKILLINPADILAVEAQGNYVLLKFQSESYHLRESISTMAEKLLPYGFVRIHRSVLVNSSCVEEIRPGTSGEYALRIVGGKEYLVSRTYKLNLKSLAQSWIGTDSFVDE